MKDGKSATSPPGKRVAFTLGREGFDRVSLVEGISLSREMRRDFRDFDRRGLSDEERRDLIRKKYVRARS
jgi:hypothetical protein